MILTALLMTVFVLVAAFAVDGGYGLFQSRQAQNAADFGAMAASKLTPCNSGVTTVSGSQVQQTVQNIVNDNESGATVTWTAKYLDGNGNAISGATFSNTASYTPPATACGVSVNVSGTWNTSLAKLAGINTAATTQGAGALGGGSLGANLAIASLMPYARHTIYAGATGAFVVNGSMFDNSVAQCNDRYDSCENYPQCLSGTPTSNIVCYGDSADVFEQSTESISGTLYSVAPVAVEPDSGVYKGIVLYQSRSTNLNIGLDDGWLYKCAGTGCSTSTYIADDATVSVTGVVYDNSFTNEPSNEVFSQIGQTFGGPYGALCAGTTSASDGGPTQCAGVPSGVNITDSAGSIQTTGAVVVGAFGTQGGTSSKPLTLTITFQSSDISLAAGNLRLIFLNGPNSRQSEPTQEMRTKSKRSDGARSHATSTAGRRQRGQSLVELPSSSPRSSPSSSA